MSDLQNIAVTVDAPLVLLWTFSLFHKFPCREREKKKKNGINLKPESESEDHTKETHAVRMKSKRMWRRFAVRKCNNGHGRAEPSV